MHHFFSRLGLTKNEEEIYLFLLEHGHTIASMIGKRLNINRVTAYASLRSLKKKGFVGSFQKNNVTYFEAATPREIVALCHNQVVSQLRIEQEAEKLFPTLQEIENKKQKPILEVKGEMKYYQGLEAVKGLIDETLQEGAKEQLCFGLNQFHIRHLKDEWRSYTKKRVATDMHVRSIQPDIAPAIHYKERDKDELRVTMLVPHESFPAECELNIIGDMIALFVTHGDRPAGMKIYHKDMAKVLTSLFELACIGARTFEKS